MKISKNWLKDYIELNLDDKELADKLTFSGTLVEEIISGIDDKVIIGVILEIKGISR